MKGENHNFWSHNRNYVLLYRYAAKHEEHKFWYNKETNEFFNEVEGELWLIREDSFFLAWKDFTHDAEIKPTGKSHWKAMFKWHRATRHEGGLQ